ncbi:uncharacterized protein BX663DRAFT_492823 [Cokeromyces recurvatus]|uniref:uncharacterized protein n=1 Tax=Cokeromyces recurvatus TaxID=90255 RepID=UPI00221F4082|nr:uncharacterized protein BX663DRAFT_492823 [Cokeromyces recurvatus]KAI7908052.1 hypothetical protein BX663DRAFT_492823 [Cokeromyces recurvatus]
MKILFLQVLAAVSAVSAAYITPRQAQQTNQTASQYPANLDVGKLNGTWRLTGITNNAWEVYRKIAGSMNIDIGCIQINLMSKSNTSMDALASAFLNNTNANVGVNASAAGVLMLPPQPDPSVNASAYEFLWNAYASQVFVNTNQWKNFTSMGRGVGTDGNNTGSSVIPGSKPVEAKIYTKLVDSNAQPGTNTSTNFDTIFVWGTDFKTHDIYQKRQAGKPVYGVILSRNPTVDGATFNKTMQFMPRQFTTNVSSIIQLNDTCSVQQAAVQRARR